MSALQSPNDRANGYATGLRMMGPLDYDALGKCHPKLARGRVWCRDCGSTRSVNSGQCLAQGWPKCCGYTMTIDPPESPQ